MHNPLHLGHRYASIFMCGDVKEMLMPYLAAVREASAGNLHGSCDAGRLRPDQDALRRTSGTTDTVSQHPFRLDAAPLRTLLVLHRLASCVQ